MKGVIFDIQRFSVHDGPGIRTTVFMKGCPLRCRWCHNPEGLSRELQLQYIKSACIGCGRCGKRDSLEDAANCPAMALKVCGRSITSDEVLEEVLRDRMFYGASGGITFSGGECLVQADFVAEVLRKAKELGLHCAIDTSGCVPWEAFEKTLPFCDLYLYDVKCMDPVLHREQTGQENTRILENLQQLATRGKEIWIRVPVIPGFNNTPVEMKAIAEYVAKLPGVTQVTLMPYHTLGASKYETLGIEQPFDISLRISEAEMDSFRKIFTDNNLLLT